MLGQIDQQNKGEFFGRTVRRRDVAGLMLAEMAYPPNLTVPRHLHSRAYFCVVLRGAFSESYGHKNREYRAATLAFHPPEEPHSERFFGTEVRSFNVEMQPIWLDRVRELSTVLDCGAEFQGGLAGLLGLRLYNEFRRMDTATPFAIEALVFEMLGEASRLQHRISARRPSGWLSSVKDRLHQSYYENLAVTQLAAQAGVHPVHLAREFRWFYGCTMGEYVRRLRIESACQELGSTDLPLTDIAFKAGFFDQSHFTRTFRRITGLTPAEYRRSVLRGSRCTVPN